MLFDDIFFQNNEEGLWDYHKEGEQEAPANKEQEKRRIGKEQATNQTEAWMH